MSAIATSPRSATADVAVSRARAAVVAASLLRDAERALGQERNAYVTTAVGPLLDDALRAVASDSGDAVNG